MEDPPGITSPMKQVVPAYMVTSSKANLERTGASCSKLTTSFVNVLLKFKT